MKEIKVSSYAKINFSIDVTGVLENGMHAVDMIMHQIDFFDDVNLSFVPVETAERGDVTIELSTNRYYLPTDQRNLAYKAAELMTERFGEQIPGGLLKIHIQKRIPVAAGMAGGSGNGAAVLHGLNVLWNLDLSLEELCNLGSALGSDVPFCVMGQARMNYRLPHKIRKDSSAVSCARATGTGTDMEPLHSVKKAVVIAKPPIGVSTREVYQGIDHCEITARPDNDAMIKAIYEKNNESFLEECINVLENYTLKAYPEVQKLKEVLLQDQRAEKVLMSGSGPTVFALYQKIAEARKACSILREQGYEAYWTKTTK
ncbi:MAG: 4-(cytidine 5'-diphospho)-2-C-methyl-D-erythritol kinase [Firmicutes bacterium]|nr:4-(cytidine 5'-diphospho)-2-C-methyl-D-erythritol kinase [Bacillota bacterium]MBR3786514.1 4-(cytidine 5'-diphospho)-2-C-methyl-D-erythritol kinase [Bacillota bacterium]